MNLKEIMMTVNSDITKPLNNLISELSDEQVVLLNNVLDKLKNISENDSGVNMSNIDLLKKISLLEQALFKAGIDPNSIYNK